MNYRWFRRKHYAAKLFFSKKLAEKGMGKEHKFIKWVNAKYKACKRDESHENDKVIENHYNEVHKSVPVNFASFNEPNPMDNPA